MMRNLGSNSSNSSSSCNGRGVDQQQQDHVITSCNNNNVEDIESEQEISRVAIATLHAKEQQIERKKSEVKERVELQLGRVEDETRRLARIWEELEELTDPFGKEVAALRKKIDITNRELKPLGIGCQKKEKEYKEAVEALNEKNKEKSQLTSTLMELLAQSEMLRSKKLEELSNIIESVNKATAKSKGGLAS